MQIGQNYREDDQVYIKRGDVDEDGNPGRRRYVICCAYTVDRKIWYCLKNKPKSKGGETITRKPQHEIAKWPDTVVYSTDEDA